jgi:hypothetical protein
VKLQYAYFNVPLTIYKGCENWRRLIKNQNDQSRRLLLLMLQRTGSETRTRLLERILGVMRPLKGQVVGTGGMSPYFRHPYSITDILPSQPGLAGVPTTLQHLREEVGLAGEPWETMGVEWQALGSLWLRTDTALTRSARTDLSFKEIHQLSIPDAWKQWMLAKAMKSMHHAHRKRSERCLLNTFAVYQRVRTQSVVP